MLIECGQVALQLGLGLGLMLIECGQVTLQLGLGLGLMLIECGQVALYSRQVLLGKNPSLDVESLTSLSLKPQASSLTPQACTSR